MEHNQSLVNFGIIDMTEEEKINLDYQSFLKAFEAPSESLAGIEVFDLRSFSLMFVEE